MAIAFQPSEVCRHAHWAQYGQSISSELSQDGQNCELISVSEKDLGLLITSNLKVSQNSVCQTACKVSKVLGMIRRHFPVLDNSDGQ